MVFKDYYKILGLETNRVTEMQIKNAYREQAKKYHPDVNVGNKNSEERFKDVNEAYRVLSEFSTKKKYDRIWIRNVNTQRSSYLQNSRNDFFTMFFGSIPESKNFVAKENLPAKGDNVEAEIKLNIKEAFKGITKNIGFSVDSNKMQEVSVKIPSGVKNNEKIRFAGEGKPGRNGGSNGDLYVKIKIADDEMVLDGCDIKKVLKISPWEAILGTKIKFSGIDEDISVYIPAETDSGTLFTINEKGYINENGVRGNLVLEVQIVIPKNCTDEEKELYSELKKISKFNPRKQLT